MVVVVVPTAAAVTLCLRCNHPAGNEAEAMIPFSDWNNADPPPDHQTQSPQPKLTVQARSVFIFYLSTTIHLCFGERRHL